MTLASEKEVVEQNISNMEVKTKDGKDEMSSFSVRQREAKMRRKKKRKRTEGKT